MVQPSGRLLCDNVTGSQNLFDFTPIRLLPVWNSIVYAVDSDLI